MAMDGFSICALTDELNRTLLGAKPDKIQQTEADELMISFFGAGTQKKLRLTANAAVARVCLTEDKKQSPQTAPLFCMLLRKHLTGARLKEVRQPDFERVMEFVFDGFDEFGEMCEKRLIAELMGRHSNIILVGADGRVIDAIRHVDFSVSSVRQVLPGMEYCSPPPQEKLNPLTCDLNTVLEALSGAKENQKIDKTILNTFRGISPLVAREICYLAFSTCDKFLKELSFDQQLDLATACIKVFSIAKEKAFSPCYLVSRDTQKPFEFSSVRIGQYEDGAEVIARDSMSQVVEEFYKERDKKERMAHKSARLVKLISTNLERCAKKLSTQLAELSDTENQETYKKYGELLTANLYRLKQGDKTAVLEDFYDENYSQITIPLDMRISPADNAQRYFKKYAKAKTAKRMLKEQLEKTKAELSYLSSVEEELELAETEQDLAEIAQELSEQGYIKRSGKDKNKKAVSKPMEFTTEDGFCVLVG
ncbi:MAG: NFACT family protein, partial [Clostridia bacterium]|nr:NFACT family protein [Clostridia bacterium]